jgi:hypothetical protein
MSPDGKRTGELHFCSHDVRFNAGLSDHRVPLSPKLLPQRNITKSYPESEAERCSF